MGFFAIVLHTESFPPTYPTSRWSYSCHSTSTFAVHSGSSLNKEGLAANIWRVKLSLFCLPKASSSTVRWVSTNLPVVWLRDRHMIHLSMTDPSFIRQCIVHELLPHLKLIVISRNHGRYTEVIEIKGRQNRKVSAHFYDEKWMWMVI